jgi:hypothetical protein
MIGRQNRSIALLGSPQPKEQKKPDDDCEMTTPRKRNNWILQVKIINALFYIPSRFPGITPACIDITTDVPGGKTGRFAEVFPVLS